MGLAREDYEKWRRLGRGQAGEKGAAVKGFQKKDKKIKRDPHGLHQKKAFFYGLLLARFDWNSGVRVREARLHRIFSQSRRPDRTV